MLLLLLFLLLPHSVSEISDEVCEATTDRYSYDYLKPGDHVIGAVLSAQIVTDPGVTFRILPLSLGQHAGRYVVWRKGIVQVRRFIIIACVNTLGPNMMSPL